MNLFSELRRRNVHRMTTLYAAAAWLVMQVVDVLKDNLPLPDWMGSAVLAVLAVGFPIALVISWFYEVTPEGISRDTDEEPAGSTTGFTGRRVDFVIIAVLAAAVLVFAYDKWWLPEPPERSVAVLPFVNMSGNPDNEYLSDGITETLLHALAQLPELKVAARTSSFYFKGQDIDARSIATKLGVANVLEGSVQRVGDELRIVAQLIEADTGFHHWSKTYDRDMGDIFAVQDDIANSVARAMQLTLSGDPDQGGSKIQTVGTDNVAAYDAYLKGVQQGNIGSSTTLLLAEVSFKEALALDPDFYEARLGLAATYLARLDNGGITLADARAHVKPLLGRLREQKPDDIFVIRLEFGLQDPETRDLEKYLTQVTAAVEQMPNEVTLYQSISASLMRMQRPADAIEWLDRGIAIDPLDWMLHFLRGWSFELDGDLDGAEAAYARAIELNPDHPSTHSRAANVQWARKQYGQAFALERNAMEADPLDHESPAEIAWILYGLGLTDEGDKYLRRAMTIAPDKAFVRQARLYQLLLLDDHTEARELSEKMLRDDIDNRFGSYRFAAMVFVSSMIELGKSEEALAVLEELRPNILSPNFQPGGEKEQWLQYHAVLVLAKTQSTGETLKTLDAVVPRWDEFFPGWRNNSGAVAAIEMARGYKELAVELTLKNLEGQVRPVLVLYDLNLHYRFINSYKELAKEPAVAERLEEIDAEVKQAGEEIWAYIVEHELQL